MGKKLLCLIMAICCVLGLASCGAQSVAMDNSAKTDNTLNGGFVAETADYVYFINGVESYTTTYETGSVTKGALLRVKKADFADLSAATYETVVSKLIVADDMNAGVYIYGDFVYYAVPSTANDKTGTVKNDQLNFFRTKLDATQTSANITARDFPHSATYRYIAAGEKVFLVVYSTELYVYDAISGKEVYTTEAKDGASALEKVDVAEVVFADSAVYFSSIPVDQALSEEDNIQKESHHVVYKLDLTASEVAPVIVLNGVGTSNVGNDSGEGVDLIGVTIDLLRVDGGKLYFSYKSLNTVSGTNPVYMAIAESALTESGNKSWKKDENVVSLTNKNTASIFADTSIFFGGKVYYVDSTFGLLVYDNAKAKENDANTDFGVSIVYYSETIASATLDFVNVEGDATFMYFHDASGIYYKVRIDEVTKETKEFRLNKHAIDTAWYKPEVVQVGENYYFVASYSDTEFKSYVYAINMTELKKDFDAWEADESEDKAEDFYAKDELDTDDDADETFVEFANRHGLLGVVADADKDEE